MLASAFPPPPRLPTSRRERLWVLLFSAALAALFAAEVVSDFTTAKLGGVFLIVFWTPALILHELGHAWMARRLGWHVSEVVIGFGRELLVFRLRETLVRFKLLPIEGYVVPHPRNLERARLKSALIYAAGPGAELLFVFICWMVLGRDLFTRSDSVSVIALQGAATAAAMGAVFNLVPYASGRGVSDGLGIILSCFATEDVFRARLLFPFIAGARQHLYREDVQGARGLLEKARLRDPGDLRVHALSAVACAIAGSHEEAYAALEDLGNPDDQPEEARVELLLAAVWVTLLANERVLFARADAACESVLELSPGDSRALLLRGRLALARDSYEEAIAILMRGYSASREREEEAQYAAYLAIAWTRAGRRDEAERFIGELVDAPLGPALRCEVSELPTHPSLS